MDSVHKNLILGILKDHFNAKKVEDLFKYNESN